VEEGSLAPGDKINWDFNDDAVINKWDSVEISLGEDFKIFKIFDSKKNDISYCYSIEVVNGKLEILP
jgi:hypothetical protein